MKLSIVNLKNYGGDGDDYVYVGRPSKYGNPYSSKPSNLPDTIVVDSKEESLDSYKQYILKNLHLVDELIDELGEKNTDKIACWCYPANCHADILYNLIKEKQNGFEL